MLKRSHLKHLVDFWWHELMSIECWLKDRQLRIGPTTSLIWHSHYSCRKKLLIVAAVASYWQEHISWLNVPKESDIFLLSTITPFYQTFDLILFLYFSFLNISLYTFAYHFLERLTMTKCWTLDFCYFYSNIPFYIHPFSVVALSCSFFSWFRGASWLIMIYGLIWTDAFCKLFQIL